MGCPAEVEIGDDLVFSICTHDPDTGVLTDADSAPTYRIYEDEGASPILTGSMAKLDDTSTTGFYSESVAATAANGFENGKTYTVYISATVDGDTGGICYGFKAATPVWGRSSRTLTQTAAQVASALSGSKITILRGDTLSVALTGLGDISTYVSLDFSVKIERDDTDDDAIIRIRKNASGSGDGLMRLNQASVSDASKGSITINNATSGNITVTLAADQTALLAKRHKMVYDVQEITSSGVSTLTDGVAEITLDVSRVVT